MWRGYIRIKLSAHHEISEDDGRMRERCSMSITFFFSFFFQRGQKKRGGEDVETT